MRRLAALAFVAFLVVGPSGGVGMAANPPAAFNKAAMASGATGVSMAPAVPGSFAKSSPANGTTGLATIGLSLAWAASSGATGYEYCLDTTNDNTCDTNWESTGSARTVQVKVAAERTYYWQVRARNNDGTTDSSGGWWSFATVRMPGAFGKSSPAHLATSQPKNVTLAWDASSEAASYAYCIDTSNNSTCDTSWVNVGTATSASPTLAAGTTYYWQVRATNVVGTIDADGGTWWRFITLSAPASFDKTSPEQGAPGVANNPTLAWGSSVFAASYEYCIDTTNDNACSGWTNVGSNLSVALPAEALLDNTAYYWQVRAVNVNGTTTADGGTWWTFTTHVHAPGAFGKSAPTNGAVDIPTGGPLSWAASTDAASYQYCVSTSPSTCIGGWTSTGAGRSVGPPNLASNTVYYWQVRAVNATSTTYANGGTWWSFTTLPQVPGSFSKTSPANAATGIAIAPTLSWATSSGAASYEYCTNTAATCSGSWTSVGNATSVSLSGLAYSTQVWWMVRARNAAGATDANSGTWWSFTTLQAAPGAFTKVAPASGSTALLPPVDLSWNASARVSSDHYCVNTTSSCAGGAWTTIGSGTTSVSVSGLQAGTTYYWEVRAVNGTGTTDSTGGWFSFTTAPLPVAFSKTLPLSGSAGVPPGSATLSWGLSIGCDSYGHCIDQTNNNDCDSGVWITRGSAVFVTLTTLDPVTAYYWQVRARNLAGTTGSNGGTWWSFVSQGLPATITWPTPAAIVYGTALSATQLNASANMTGSFAYSPSAGSVLNAGAGQTLSTTFTPTDSVNYPVVTDSRTIDVNKATATLAFGSLTFGYDGATKPVAVGTTPGGLSGVSVTYNGSATPPSAVGTYAVAASLTHANYEATPISGTLSIVQNTFVTNVNTVSVPEGGTATVQVKLGAQPGATVTATVSRNSGDTDLTVSGGSTLTFTTSNWNTYQTVTLAAAEDVDAVNGSATIRVVAGGVADKDVTATEVDNDASTPTFSDDPLVVRTTAIKAAHITELRTAIDTLRARNSLTAFAWTDPALTAVVTSAKAVHVTELRTALNAVYTAEARALPTYTNGTITAGTTIITATDVAELRAAILAIW